MKTIEWRKVGNSVCPRHCVVCGRDTYLLNGWEMIKKEGDKSGTYSISLCEGCEVSSKKDKQEQP